MGPSQLLAARGLSKSTCEGDFPPLDLPKSNTDLFNPEQVTKCYGTPNGTINLSAVCWIFTKYLKQISERPLLYLFILVNLSLSPEIR